MPVSIVVLLQQIKLFAVHDAVRAIVHWQKGALTDRPTCS